MAERAGLAPPPRIYGLMPLLALLAPPFFLLPGPLKLAAALPLALALLPLLRLQAVLAKRRWALRGELPFMALLVSLFGLRGALALPRALELASSLPRALLPGMREEGLRYSLMALLRGKGPLAALLEYARHHPEPTWKAYVEGYVAVAEKGSSPHEYARTYLDVYLTRLEQEWARSYMSLGSFVELAAVLMALTPALAVLLGLLYSLGLAYATILLILLLSPALTPAFLALASLLQARAGDSYPTKPLFALAPAPGLAFALYLWAGLPLHQALSLSLFASLALAAPWSFLRARRLRRLEAEALRLLEELLELLRMGETPLSALSRLVAHDRGPLTPFLLKLRWALETGASREEAFTGSPSRLVNFLLFSLVLASEQGGGLEEVDRIRRFLLKYLEARRALTRTSLASLGVAMFTPALSLYAIHLLGTILAQPSLLGGPAPASEFGSLLELAKLVPLEAALSLGLILSKGVGQTIRDLRYPLLALAPVALLTLIF